MVGKNPKIRNLSHMADDAITQGSIGDLGSLMNMCGFVNSQMWNFYYVYYLGGTCMCVIMMAAISHWRMIASKSNYIQRRGGTVKNKSDFPPIMCKKVQFPRNELSIFSCFSH